MRLRPCQQAVAAAAIALAFIPGPATGQWMPDGVPVAATSAFEAEPAIAADGAGGAFIAWSGGGLRAQRLDHSGVPLWDPAGIEVLGHDSICPDGEGGMYCVESGGLNILVQRYDVSGNVASGWPAAGVVAATLPPSTYVELHSDRVSLSSDGGVLVAWIAYLVPYPHEGYYGVYAQKLSAAGAPLWGANGAEVYPISSDDPRGASIVSDGAGGAFVTWNDFRSFAAAQRIGSNGSMVWQAQGVPLGGGASASYPGSQTIAADGSGGALVAWTSGSSASATDVYVQRVTAGGALLWGPNAVRACGAAELQSSPCVVSDGLGGAFVAWGDGRNPQREAYVQRVLDSGSIAAGWPTDGLRAGTTGNACYPAGPQLVPDAEGGVLLTWGVLCGGTIEILAQRLAASGAISPGWPADGVVVCDAPAVPGAQRSVTDGEGGLITVWEDSRQDPSARPDIYAQRVNAGGVPLATAIQPPAVALGLAAHPNPASGRLTFVVQLPADGPVSLEIVDVGGRLIRAVASRIDLPAGSHAFEWDGRDARGQHVPVGMYFASLQTDRERTVRRVTLTR